MSSRKSIAKNARGKINNIVSRGIVKFKQLEMQTNLYRLTSLVVALATLGIGIWFLIDEEKKKEPSIHGTGIALVILGAIGLLAAIFYGGLKFRK